MAAASTTARQDSALGWAKILGKIFYLLFALLIVFLIFKSTKWNVGLISIFVAALGYILIFFDSELKRLALFILITLYFAADLSIGAYRLLTTNESVLAAIRESSLLSFLLSGDIDRVVWSIVLGFILAPLLTLTPILILAAASSFYVLALHKIEGISRWDAILYNVSLILGINWAYIVVENGQAVITKDAAWLSVLGGPGHLIVKQGNVVVLERGGKITRIVNAGVTKLEALETIRNIFVLGAQSNSAEVDDVLTKDRIPLKITLKVAYQIEPAGDADKRDKSHLPDDETKTKKLVDGLYQVYEGTILKVARTSQATIFAKREVKKCKDEICYDVEQTEWQKVVGGVPDGELRDYIMSHRIDELFELINSNDTEEPEIRANKRKIYEIEQAILAKIKSGKAENLGILVRGVDIVKIEFPSKLKTAIIESMSSGERALGQAQAIASVGNAKTESVAVLLDRMITLIDNALPYADPDTVRQFVIILQNIYQGALRDDVLIKDVVEANSDALKALAQSEGPKVFSTGTFTDPTQLLLSQVRTNG